jgi:hypothetical protein
MKKNSIIFVGLAILTVVALVFYSSTKSKDGKQLASGVPVNSPTPTQGASLRGFESTSTTGVNEDAGSLNQAEMTKGGLLVDPVTPSLVPQQGAQGVAKNTQVVRLTDGGFLPTIITDKVGMTLLFVNESAISMRLNEEVVKGARVLLGFGMTENLGKNGMYEYVLRAQGKATIVNSNKPTQKIVIEIK